MTLWIYQGAFAQPDTATPFDDTDENWLEGLAVDALQVVEPRKKVESLAVCGAEFAPGTDTKNQDPDNLLWSHALVLDVDVWHDAEGNLIREPFTLDELKELFEGFRFIAWNTYSSSADCRKWRVVLPLKERMPPGKYRPLWRIMNDLLEGTMAEASTADPARLGFLGTVNSESAKDHYEYFISRGERLDWQAFDLPDEDLNRLSHTLEPADLSRSPDWTTDSQALTDARRYYRRVGEEVEVGSRHHTLLMASCRLWWDWAAPGEAFVRDVLSMINHNFIEPKDEEEIEKEIQAGYDRVFGANRVEQPNFYGVEREPVARATSEAVQALAKRLKSRSNAKSRQKGGALEKICRKKIFADANTVRGAAFLAAEALASEFFGEQPERLLDLMRPSLMLQRRDQNAPVPTDPEILQKIRWTQGARKKKLEEQQKEELDKRKQNIRTAFGSDRDTGYSAKEYRRFTAAGFKNNQWILQGTQTGRSFYFFVDGSYRGPFAEKAASNFSRVLLSPAYDRVALSKVESSGELKEKSFDELVQEYGTFVTEIERSLTESTSKVVGTRLVQAVSPLRDLQPAHSDRVEMWLQLLGGARYDVLLDWLAALTFLDRPAAALYLSAPEGSGKTMLFEGLNRLWSKQPLKRVERFSDFDVEETPLFFLEGNVPKRWAQGVGLRVGLKNLVEEKVRRVKKPYIEEYSVYGHVRPIIAHTQPNLLSKWLDYSDLKLVSACVALVHNTDTDAADYLRSLGPAGREFGHTDEVAKHVLWLRENHDLKGHRYALAPERQGDFAVVNQMTLPDVSRVMDWIVGYLTLGRFSTRALVSHDGKLYVNPSKVFGAWSTVEIDRKGISPRELYRALQKMCVGVEMRGEKGNYAGRSTEYFVLEVEKVKLWCEINDTPFESVAQALGELAQKARFSNRGQAADDSDDSDDDES